jgi:CheY-like chemotaxis protein
LPRSILIVDDHREIRELLGEVLTDDGYRVTVARDGIEGRRLLERGVCPDVILADVMMPGFSGAELVSWVRDSELHRNVRVVLMSASPLPVALAGRADAFLPKPFDLVALARAVTGNDPEA